MIVPILGKKIWVSEIKLKFTIYIKIMIFKIDFYFFTSVETVLFRI
jgi:hypothetical protein